MLKTITKAALASSLLIALGGAASAEGLVEMEKNPSNWVMPTGNYANHRYSELDKINKDNVGKPEIKLAPRAARPPKKLTRGDSRAFNLLGRRHSAGEVEDKAPGERRGSMIPRSISDRLPGRGRRQSAQPDFSHLSHLSAVAGKKGERRNSALPPFVDGDESPDGTPPPQRPGGPGHLRPESSKRQVRRPSRFQE